MAGRRAGKDSPLAFRWRAGKLEQIQHPDVYPLDALIGVERSVAKLRANVAAFTAGRPALDALLYGERGTGKSSAVRGLLGEFGARGFRLVEVRRDDLLELARLWPVLRKRRERFAVFCDDLSFEEGDTSWKQLKAELDGGLEARPANALVIATSNRRHLVPERMSENREAVLDRDGLLHPGETAEEKVSLSDRFGLLLPFFAFDQETYLRIARHHARALGIDTPADFEARVLRFALERGTRSGRTARQACIALAQSLAEDEP
ncbi:MAG TPA: ATP-binding protein [Myxococcota bacterium]|nr:ATP-binding protein [Myxococcota bacterium]